MKYFGLYFTGIDLYFTEPDLYFTNINISHNETNA